MYEKPKLDLKYKTENWKDFPQDDRLRCHVCRGIYWRLWEDVAQCMGCRSYTGFVVNGPTGTLRDVGWINFALQANSDTRVRDPISGRSEWVVEHDKLKGRTSDQEMVLSPSILGTWLMDKTADPTRKALSNKEAINVIKRSTALKNRRGDVGLAMLGLLFVSVYLFNIVQIHIQKNNPGSSRMNAMSSEVTQNVQR